MYTAALFVGDGFDLHLGALGELGHLHRAAGGQGALSEILGVDAVHGGEIIDVIVEHPLYGELTGTLHIKTPQDIDSFMRRYQKSNASLLSELTGGIHLHTIRYPEKHMLKTIKQKLAEAGILYEG